MKQCNRKREVQDDLISTRTPPPPPNPRQLEKSCHRSGQGKLLVEQFWGTESSCSILDVIL